MSKFQMTGLSFIFIQSFKEHVEWNDFLTSTSHLTVIFQIEIVFASDSQSWYIWLLHVSFKPKHSFWVIPARSWFSNSFPHTSLGRFWSPNISPQLCEASSVHTVGVKRLEIRSVIGWCVLNIVPYMDKEGVPPGRTVLTCAAYTGKSASRAAKPTTNNFRTDSFTTGTQSSDKKITM